MVEEEGDEGVVHDGGEQEGVEDRVHVAGKLPHPARLNKTGLN